MCWFAFHGREKRAFLTIFSRAATCFARFSGPRRLACEGEWRQAPVAQTVKIRRTGVYLALTLLCQHHNRRIRRNIWCFGNILVDFLELDASLREIGLNREPHGFHVLARTAPISIVQCDAPPVIDIVGIAAAKAGHGFRPEVPHRDDHDQNKYANHAPH